MGQEWSSATVRPKGQKAGSVSPYSAYSAYSAYNIIQKKRDNTILSPGEILWFIERFTQNKIPDYQMSAFLMAIYLNGMNEGETATLTNAMLHSGKTLPPFGPQAIDKHSTGGVGDKTSFITGPIAAGSGVKVPMIAGRGLGHTGGTIDKIESLAGFKTTLDLKTFARQVETRGMALITQTADIAPTDGKLYALRDVTATIESIPLITASIMSKKLAEGLKGIIIDIKMGRGAFMSTLDSARSLARGLRETALRFDKDIMTIISDMSSPLGQAIGNSLEVIESIEVLKGRGRGGPEDLIQLSLELAGGMIYLAELAPTHGEGIRMARETLGSGAALEAFRRLVVAQGGDVSFIDDYSKFSIAPHKTVVRAPKSGYIHDIDAKQLGIHMILLGGGRLSKEDTIDLGVGMFLHKKVGEKVDEGATLLDIYHREGQDTIARQIAEDIAHNGIILKESKLAQKRDLIIERKIHWSSSRNVPKT